MKRQALLTLLHNYVPITEQEQLCKDEMISFVEHHEHCFERTLAKGHVTASAWIIDNNHEKALLMHHAKLGRWLQLGGHCDGNPDVLAVAIKEAQEESGINAIVPVHNAIFDIDIHLIPANSREAEHYHYDVRFLLRVASNEQVVQNKESKELKWVGKLMDELPTQERSVIRMHTKWLNAI